MRQGQLDDLAPVMGVGGGPGLEACSRTMDLNPPKVREPVLNHLAQRSDAYRPGGGVAREHMTVGPSLWLHREDDRMGPV